MRESREKEEAVPHPVHHTSPGDFGLLTALCLSARQGCKMPEVVKSCAIKCCFIVFWIPDSAASN